MLYGLLFQLLVYNENNLLVKSLRLNSSVLSVLVNNLTQAHVYTVGLKAFTRLGAGPAVEVTLALGVCEERYLCSSSRVFDTSNLWLYTLTIK